MSYYRFKKSLFTYLNLDHKKSYSIEEIKEKLQATKINNEDLKKIFPNFLHCGCGSCSVDIDKLANHVKKELKLKSDKPECYYFEYNQVPVTVEYIISS